MKTIYFARHGEYLNPDSIIPYRLPGFPLSPTGINQAIKLGNNLLTAQVTQIYCSPILRAKQTAQIIGKIISVQPNITQLAIETYTPFQGIKKEAISRLSPNYPYDIPKHVEGKGDSPELIYQRMNKLVNRILSKKYDSTTLIVSHGDPIVIYLKAVFENRIPHLMAEFDQGKVKYPAMGSLVRVDYDNSIPSYTEIL